MSFFPGTAIREWVKGQVTTHVVACWQGVLTRCGADSQYGYLSSQICAAAVVDDFGNLVAVEGWK